MINIKYGSFALDAQISRIYSKCIGRQQELNRKRYRILYCHFWLCLFFILYSSVPNDAIIKTSSNIIFKTNALPFKKNTIINIIRIIKQAPKKDCKFSILSSNIFRTLSHIIKVITIRTANNIDEDKS